MITLVYPKEQNQSLIMRNIYLDISLFDVIKTYQILYIAPHAVLHLSCLLQDSLRNLANMPTSNREASRADLENMSTSWLLELTKSIITKHYKSILCRCMKMKC